MEKKYIYVMLSQTNTWISRLIKIVRKKPYAHASVSFDRRLHHMYSYGRIWFWCSSIAGLVHELPDRNLYMHKPNTKMVLLRAEVTEEQHERAKHALIDLWNHRYRRPYNTIGLWLSALKIYLPVKHAFFCSQFTAYIVQSAGVDFTDKPYIKVEPEDFRLSDRFEVVYEGSLRDYWNKYSVTSDGKFNRY